MRNTFSLSKKLAKQSSSQRLTRNLDTDINDLNENKLMKLLPYEESRLASSGKQSDEPGQDPTPPSGDSGGDSSGGSGQDSKNQSG